MVQLTIKPEAQRALAIFKYKNGYADYSEAILAAVKTDEADA